VIDELNFEAYNDRHAFDEIYETILKSLQSAGNAGEFYTPRAVTDFMAQMLSPKLGERIADFACSTGGFLTSALKQLDKQIKTPADRELYNNSIYGIEEKALPHLLCVTNMLLHDIDNLMIIHSNSLEKNVHDYRDDDRFDVILMNPPYGGSEKESVKNQFSRRLAFERNCRPVYVGYYVSPEKTRKGGCYHSRRFPVWYGQCQSNH
jgi:type I restriction enzyme M protein